MRSLVSAIFGNQADRVLLSGAAGNPALSSRTLELVATDAVQRVARDNTVGDAAVEFIAYTPGTSIISAWWDIHLDRATKELQLRTRFAADVNHLDVLSLTEAGGVRLMAGTTSRPPLNIPHGSAPSSPVNGDIWTTTAGMFARINGATVDLGAGGGGGGADWTTVTKAADEVSATTTMVDDATLRFAMAANTKYRFRIMAFIESLAAADLKIGLNGPAIGTGRMLYRRTHNVPVAAAGTYTPVSTLQTAYGDLAAITHAVANGLAIVEFDGFIHNGATAGDCIFRYACNTATANGVTLRAGSYLEYKAV